MRGNPKKAHIPKIFFQYAVKQEVGPAYPAAKTMLTTAVCLFWEYALFL
jgi:hypothetical protein